MQQRMTLGEIEKKVKPIAERFVEECRAEGLTLGEFHVLCQLIRCEYDRILKEREKTMSCEKL